MNTITMKRGSQSRQSFDSHSDRLLPFGAVGVVAFLRLLGLSVDRHFHIGTGTEPVLPVPFEFRRQHWNRKRKSEPVESRVTLVQKEKGQMVKTTTLYAF